MTVHPFFIMSNELNVDRWRVVLREAWDLHIFPQMEKHLLSRDSSLPQIKRVYNPADHISPFTPDPCRLIVMDTGAFMRRRQLCNILGLHDTCWVNDDKVGHVVLNGLDGGTRCEIDNLPPNYISIGDATNKIYHPNVYPRRHLYMLIKAMNAMCNEQAVDGELMDDGTDEELLWLQGPD